MYNTNVFNVTPYNTLFSPSGLAAQDNIVFNGYSLQSSTVSSRIAKHEVNPTRELLRNKIPRNDGMFIVGDFWREKTIRIEGIIRQTSAALLDTEIDNFKKAMAVREGTLDIKNSSGTIRRYQATLVNVDVVNRENYNITFVRFSLSFVSVDPFGHDVNYSEELFSDKTDLVSNEFISNIGTVRALGIYTLTFSAASGITAVQVSNNTNTELILSTVNISAGDVIVFDGEQRIVTLNGTQIDYSGFFPSLDTGPNSFTITLTGTSATFTLSMKYLPPYL